MRLSSAPHSTIRQLRNGFACGRVTYVDALFEKPWCSVQSWLPFCVYGREV